ncbi:MAG: ABC transporter ATP-binding protein [Saprospiraceae bacterium]
MIQINQLYKSFGKLEVLKGIDLEFSGSGRITAILGPNGSGKTTLIKCLLGMVIPQDGTILFDGKEVSHEWGYRNAIDYLPQITRFPDNLTVREVIDLIQQIRGNTTGDRTLIQQFGLEKYLDDKVRNLSGGTRQKLNLTLTFMYDNPVLILDEPSNGLDPVAMQQLRKLVAARKAAGKIVLMTTHIMSLVEEMADEVVFLLEGKIYFKGSVEMLKARYGETSVEAAIAAILQQEQDKPSTQFAHQGIPSTLQIA